MQQESDFQLFSSLRYDPLLSGLPINTEHWDAEPKTGSPFYMLPFHRDRILQAAEHFGWTEAAIKFHGREGFDILLKSISEAISQTSLTPLRVRILLSRDGSIRVESSPTPSVSQFNLFPERGLPQPRGIEVKVSPLTGGALMLGENDEAYGDPERSTPWDVMPDKERTPPTSFTSYKTTNRDMYTGARERVGIQDMTEKREVLIVSERDGEIMEGSLTSVFLWRNGAWTTPPVASGGQIGTTRRWALEKGFCVEGVVRIEDLVDGEECWISNGVRGFILGKIKLS